MKLGDEVEVYQGEAVVLRMKREQFKALCCALSVAHYYRIPLGNPELLEPLQIMARRESWDGSYPSGDVPAWAEGFVAARRLAK